MALVSILSHCCRGALVVLIIATLRIALQRHPSQWTMDASGPIARVRDCRNERGTLYDQLMRQRELLRDRPPSLFFPIVTFFLSELPT